MGSVTARLVPYPSRGASPRRCHRAAGCDGDGRADADRGLYRFLFDHRARTQRRSDFSPTKSSSLLSMVFRVLASADRTKVGAKWLEDQNRVCAKSRNLPSPGLHVPMGPISLTRLTISPRTFERGGLVQFRPRMSGFNAARGSACQAGVGPAARARDFVSYHPEKC